MKPSLIAALVLGAVSLNAYAQSQVTLYGIIDTGVVIAHQTVDPDHKGKNKVYMGSAFDLGSRWGIRGVEDLGNQWKVGFNLEQGFNPTSGEEHVSGKAFSRESVLWVENDIARLGMGRMATLGSGLGTYDMISGYAFKGGYGLIGWPITSPATPGYYGGDFLRVDNGVVLMTKYQSGFRLGLMYSNGTSGDSNKWSRNNHYYGIGLEYKQGPWHSSLIFEAEDEKPRNWIVDGVQNGTGQKPRYILNYGVEYNAGSITPMFAYRWIHQDEGVKTHTFGLSAVIPAWGGRFKTAVRYTFGTDYLIPTNVSLTETHKVRNIAVGVAYEYPLSKRTVLKPFVGYAKSYKAWKNAYMTPGTSSNAVMNGYQIYLGMHHFF